jgi:hypothetical protein
VATASATEQPARANRPRRSSVRVISAKAVVFTAHRYTIGWITNIITTV